MGGKTSTAAKYRWNSANYERITVSVPKEDGKRFKEKCIKRGVSQAEVLKERIYEFLED